MRELARALPPEAVVVEDAGTANAALHEAIEFNEPGRLHGVRGGAMGWGMGAALGVQLADPGRRVICVVGDGTAAMTVQALWTAARAQLPVVYVVCNNGSYRVLKVNAQTYRRMVPSAEPGAPADALVDLAPPVDFAEIAVAFGVHGRHIDGARAIGPAVAEAVARREPALLDVSIDGSVS
jgi:benzoylformate decarboxylase